MEDKGGKLVGEIKGVDRQWGLDRAGEINEERRKGSRRDQRGGQAVVVRLKRRDEGGKLGR